MDEDFKENTNIMQEDPLQASYHIWGMQQNSDVVYDFLMGERGFFWDKYKKEYVKFQNQEENFNELGLRDMYSILHSVANRSNVLGDLDKKQINQIMLNTMITVVKNLTRNKKRWDLKEHSRDTLVQNTRNMLLLFLTKTTNGQTASLMYGSNGMQERITHDDSFDKANGVGGILR